MILCLGSFLTTVLMAISGEIDEIGGGDSSFLGRSSFTNYNRSLISSFLPDFAVDFSCTT